jgi:hypothetical protein
LSRESELGTYMYLLEKPPVAQIFKNFPTFYGDSKVLYRVPKSPPLVSILSQINPANTILFYLSKICFKITLSIMVISS